MFLGFQTWSFQTQPAQLQRLTRALKFNGSMFSYNSFQGKNNRGADQTVRVRRLVCALFVRMQTTPGFLTTRLNYLENPK